MRVRRRWWYWVLLPVVAVFAAFAGVGLLPTQRESRVEGDHIVTRTRSRVHYLLPLSDWGFNWKRFNVCGTQKSAERNRWRIGFFEVINEEVSEFRPLDEHTQQSEQ